MARGSDAKAAEKDLKQKVAGAEDLEYQNLQELIDQQHNAADQDTVRAAHRKVDEAAAADLDLDDIDMPDGIEGKVLAATVRGEFISVVGETDSGRPIKWVVPREGKKGRQRRPARASGGAVESTSGDTGGGSAATGGEAEGEGEAESS